MDPDLGTLAALSATAFVAGFVDSIAGGGGLLTVPALLLAGLDPVTAVATNKVQGTLSIASALVAYGRAGLVEWRLGAPMGMVAVLASMAGALSVHSLDRGMISSVIPLLLISVALYFGFARGPGDADSRARLPRLAFILLVVPPIAFYDGFVGPGAGSFYAVALVTLQGFGLVRTTAMAKVLNGGSNAGSLLLFTLAGSVFWPLGLLMGFFSMLGAQIGARFAVKRGTRIIRPLIVLVSCAISARMLLDPANPLHHMLVELPLFR